MKTNILLLTAIIILLGCSSPKTYVTIQTELGNIRVEIFTEKAPVTAINFLRYVDGNLFEGGSFYRIVHMDNQPNNEAKIEVIQGGISRAKRPDGFPPIEHETTDKTGVLHKNGIISMARSRPGTASSEFFICIGDQPELDFGGKRNPNGQGFAAFGKVVKGMDVVKQIQQSPAEEQSLTPRIEIFNIIRNQ